MPAVDHMEGLLQVISRSEQIGDETQIAEL